MINLSKMSGYLNDVEIAQNANEASRILDEAIKIEENAREKDSPEELYKAFEMYLQSEVMLMHATNKSRLDIADMSYGTYEDSYGNRYKGND